MLDPLFIFVFGWGLVGAAYATLVGTMTLATAVAARVGVVEVAAHQVASQLWLFLSLTVDSVAVAAQALAFLLAEPLLIGLFATDPGVIATLERVYPFVVLVQPLNSLVFVLDGVFMGAEQFRFLARAMLIAAAGANVLLLLVLPLDWGLIGVWWGMTALMGLRAVTLLHRYLAPRGVLARR